MESIQAQTLASQFRRQLAKRKKRIKAEARKLAQANSAHDRRYAENPWFRLQFGLYER